MARRISDMTIQEAHEAGYVFGKPQGDVWPMRNPEGKTYYPNAKSKTCNCLANPGTCKHVRWAGEFDLTFKNIPVPSHYEISELVYGQ